MTGIGTANQIADTVREAKDYFSNFRPDTRSVRFNYRERTSEMKIYVEVPDSRKRDFADVEIPLSGYRLKEMFSLPDFHPVESGILYEDGVVTFDPSDLPSHDEYLVVLEGDVASETMEHLVDLKTPEDPDDRGGIEEYWVRSALKQPAIMKEVYDNLKVENVDISVQVGVQRCFSNTVPSDVRDVWDSSRDLIEASSDYDRNQVHSSARQRHDAIQKLDTNPGHISDFLRSLATARHLEDYISVERPYRRRNISPDPPETNLFPEVIGVDITTNLSLDQKAADGTLRFEKSDYQDFLEQQIDSEL